MKKTVKIAGMACKNCKKAVEGALSRIDGITSVSVDLENGNAVIESTGEIADELIKNAVYDAGFDVLK